MKFEIVLVILTILCIFAFYYVDAAYLTYPNFERNVTDLDELRAQCVDIPNIVFPDDYGSEFDSAEYIVLLDGRRPWSKAIGYVCVYTSQRNIYSVSASLTENRNAEPAFYLNDLEIYETTYFNDDYYFDDIWFQLGSIYYSVSCSYDKSDDHKLKGHDKLLPWEFFGIRLYEKYQEAVSFI